MQYITIVARREVFSNLVPRPNLIAFFEKSAFRSFAIPSQIIEKR